MGKIISIVDREKRYCSEKILDIINILDDYDVEFRIDREEILLILSDLYDLYLKKEIAYQYLEDMLLYFNEICKEISEEEKVFDLDSICNGLLGCYELMVPIGLEREDFDDVVQKVKVKINKRRKADEK